MGLFSKRSAQPIEQLSEDQASEWLGLEGRVIFRDSPGIVGMYCTNVALEPGWYACTLQNKGNQVNVLLNGRMVAALDRNCLGDAVAVFNASGRREARAILQPRPAGRKTATVYARA
jgi:hypothetical protein